MRIGELAEQAAVTTKTIRYYESIGILPTPDRTPSGYRAYDATALERLRFVRDAQATGLTLIEIKSILELKGQGEQSCEHTRSLIHRQIDVDDMVFQSGAAITRSDKDGFDQGALGGFPGQCMLPAARANQ